MRKTREILRQKWVLGRTHRAIASSVGVSAGVVGAVMVAVPATLAANAARTQNIGSLASAARSLLTPR